MTSSACTITDIAQFAGVSETTVSLAFRPGSRISDATRQRVLDLAKEHDYVPNQAARQLRQQRSTTIGMMVPDLTDGFFTRMARALESQLSAAGYSLMISESNWQGDKEDQGIANMIEARLCAVLLCSSERGTSGLQLLQNHRVPHILLDTAPSDYVGPAIIGDFPRIGSEAGKHLRQRAYSKAALLSVEAERANYSSLAAMSEAFSSVWPDATTICAGTTREDARLATQRAINDGHDAFFCHNDVIAIGALEAIHALGKRPGQDIGVLGVDDSDVAASSLIQLSSFALPCDAIAASASTALIATLQDKQTLHIHSRIPAQLQQRSSTRR